MIFGPRLFWRICASCLAGVMSLPVVGQVNCRLIWITPIDSSLSPQAIQFPEKRMAV